MLTIGQVKETGIVLGHGNNASEWKGKLLTDIAVFLAMQGAAQTLHDKHHHSPSSHTTSLRNKDSGMEGTQQDGLQSYMYTAHQAVKFVGVVQATWCCDTAVGTRRGGVRRCLRNLWMPVRPLHLPEAYHAGYWQAGDNPSLFTPARMHGITSRKSAMQQDHNLIETELKTIRWQDFWQGPCDIQ